MRALLLLLPLLLAAVLAGCTESDPTRDGRATVLVVNAGPSAFAKIVGEHGEVAWSGRMLERQSQTVVLLVREDGCRDHRLLAGYEGEEPTRVMSYLAPCDRDLEPLRVEFHRPER